MLHADTFRTFLHQQTTLLGTLILIVVRVALVFMLIRILLWMNIYFRMSIYKNTGGVSVPLALELQEPGGLAGRKPSHSPSHFQNKLLLIGDSWISWIMWKYGSDEWLNRASDYTARSSGKPKTLRPSLLTYLWESRRADRIWRCLQRELLEWLRQQSIFILNCFKFVNLNASTVISRLTCFIVYCIFVWQDRYLRMYCMNGWMDR